MKLLKKVSAREVKRAYVIPQLIQSQNRAKRYLHVSSPEEFSERLARAKRKGLSLTVVQLDRAIAKDFPKRLHAYDRSDWYLAEVRTKEIGVWKRAGSLPLSWTKDSLHETALAVQTGMKKGSKLVNARARRAISGILDTCAEETQREKYLLPILFASGTGTDGRKGLAKLKGDIDDGNMRSVALAIAGKKTLRVYIGFPKKQI